MDSQSDKSVPWDKVNIHIYSTGSNMKPIVAEIYIHEFYESACYLSLKLTGCIALNPCKSAHRNDNHS